VAGRVGAVGDRGGRNRAYRRQFIQTLSYQRRHEVKTRSLALAAIGTLLAGAALAAPGDKKPKTVELTTCPMTKESSVGAKGGTELVKVGKTTYQVDFCCAGCKPEFDKLSTKEKQAKVAELAKKTAKKS